MGFRFLISNFRLTNLLPGDDRTGWRDDKHQYLSDSLSLSLSLSLSVQERLGRGEGVRSPPPPHPYFLTGELGLVRRREKSENLLV